MSNSAVKNTNPGTNPTSQPHTRPLCLPAPPNERFREEGNALWAKLGGSIVFQNIFDIEAQLYALEEARQSEVLSGHAPWLRHYCEHIRNRVTDLTQEITILLLENGIVAE